jgi:hypothetical protein
MSQNERVQQATERTKKLYSDYPTVFINASASALDHLDVFKPELGEFIQDELSPEEVVELYLSEINAFDPNVHDSLKRHLEDLAITVGRVCTLKLIDNVEDNRISYSLAASATVTDSGLLPSTRLAVSPSSSVTRIFPAIEIAGQSLDPSDFPFIHATHSIDELGRRYILPWEQVRSINLN